MKQWNNEEFFTHWHGYAFQEGEFMGQPYVVVFPEKGTENGKWILKTEYFGAFPETELALLKRGYHVANVKTTSRWCPDSVTEMQAAFVDFVHAEFGLSEQCIPVGMSCGGMQAIFLAAKYPEKVSCMYIDAPVVNFLSCPFGFGRKTTESATDEFIKARGLDEIAILSFRKHPLDFIPALTTHHIPIVLVSGDTDTVVPFEENGKLLWDAYKAAGCTIETYIKPGGDHHPHGLPDVSPIVHFIEKYSK
ncbi:MAG: alpha/beta fold hydrolase [Clostridia bacterium]|nr:alpha/beta fold hydrolase [Clostridia bacterium]